MYYLEVSVGQVLVWIFGSSAQGLTRQKSRCQPRTQFSPGPRGALQAHVAVGRVHFLGAL